MAAKVVPIRSKRYAESYSGMPTEFLQCRGFKHPELPVYRYELSRTTAVIFLECLSCHRTREVEVRKRDGARRSRTPVYPNGYLLKDARKKWGDRQLVKANVTVELLGRIPTRKRPAKSTGG